jgi:two-component system cell cycle sensor histidine kinase/response regulator CckA
MSSVPSTGSPSSRFGASLEPKQQRILYFAIGCCGLLLTFAATGSKLTARVVSSGYLPHSYCYLGNPRLVWSHVISDSIIALSYFVISITLAHIVYRFWRDIPFQRMFLAFGLFIIACGFTHFMEVVTVWDPVYFLSAFLKGFTALASITTAIALPFLVPEILLMVRKAKESEQYLRFLESGLSEKEAAQGELRKINELLEARVQDRTLELAKTNEELRTSEKQYRLLFESSPMPMWVFDRSTLKFLAVNEAATRLYGYSCEEFLAMSIAGIRPKEDIPKLMDSMSKRGSGLSEAEVWRHQKKDKTVIEVEITSHAISVGGREAELILSHDVTEQRKSEETLRQSEDKFAKAFRSSPLPITISTEAEGRYIDVNDAFVKVMGYERQEVLGRTACELGIWVEPQDRCKLLEILEPHGRAQALATRFRTKSGEERRVQISAERIVLDGIPCMLANTLDVTESQRLEEQFRQAQKMEAVGRLAGGVAHDFNNLLSVIVGYSELAQDLIAPGANVRKHLDHIKQAADRAAALTRQLLAFSRQQVMEPRVLSLNTVVHNISKMLLRVIGEDITLSLKPGEPLGSVKADLGQIEQVLMNLVVNARDAMPDGGKIIIETSDIDLDATYAKQHLPVPSGSYVMLSLSDTGCGMDAKTMSKIFEPFFTTKGPGKGTGLGLSTVYGIVKQSGGYIWAYSELGQGTTFKIYLPRVDSPAEVLAVQKSDLVFDRGTETILVVEDDNALRAVTSDLLRGAGYSVLEADDGNAAIEVAEQHRDSIHLVLTDVVMPGMNGTDLIAHLRRLQPKLAILFMSGYASDLIARAGVQEPERFVLHKPFTRTALLKKVRATLDDHSVTS